MIVVTKPILPFKALTNQPNTIHLSDEFPCFACTRKGHLQVYRNLLNNNHDKILNYYCNVFSTANIAFCKNFW